MNARAVHLVGGLGVSGAVALGFALLGVPLALIFGSLLGAALYANIARPLPGAANLRRGGQLLVGTAVGMYLSADVLGQLWANLPLMVGAAVLANLVGLALAVPIAWIAGTDRLTGVLCCLPAGMAEMSSLAHDMKADEQVVTITHSLRVVLVVLSLPLILGQIGDVPRSAVALSELQIAYPIIIVAGGALAVLARRLGALNPWVIAPMAIGLIHAAWIGPVPPTPRLFADLAQIAIGASLGARLDLRRLRHLPRAALAGALSATLMIAILSGAVAQALAPVAGVDPRTMMLAVAPGGLGEMIASASALGLGVSMVAGFQFVRSALTNLFAPALIKRFVRP